MTIQQEIITSILTKFPKLPTMTVARKAYTENKSAFTTLEAARTAVRAIRGAKGKEPIRIPGFERAKQLAGAGSFSKLPDGLKHYAEWNPILIPGPLKMLVLSDMHIPYHSKLAIQSAIDYGVSAEVDTVLLNGDTCDFFAMSFWEKDPRQRNFPKELETVRSYLRAIREAFPEARIIFKEGNHEERYERYMRVKAAELLGVDDFALGKILRLEKYKIEHVKDRLPIRFGDLNIIHGHEYRFAISNPVNPARGLFLRAKAYAMCGHFHQSSSHSERTVEQKNRGTWSTGCLCDLHPDYAPLNNWNHGFAVVQVFDDGKFHVENRFISKDGKVY